MALTVLLDARKLGDGGIGVYIENLVCGLTALSGAPELRLIVSPRALKKKSEETRLHVENLLREWSSGVRVVIDDARPYSLDEAVGMGRRLRDAVQGADLFHAPHYTVPFFLPVPKVVTVHDVIHITHPEHLLHRPVATAMIRSAVKRAHHVVCVSAHSGTELERLVPNAEQKMTIIPNSLRRGIGAGESTIERGSCAAREHMLSREYFLFVGSDRPHKGFSELVRGWALLKEDAAVRGGALPQLAVVGTRFSESARALVREHGVSDDVVFLGEVSVERLHILYGASAGVIVPSQVEGFGLPALEAMASGVPVICSPLNSLQEVCGKSAWYLEAVSPRAICDGILSCRENGDERRKKIALGEERAKLFTQRSVAEQTLEIYEKVAERTALGRGKGQGRDGGVFSEENRFHATENRSARVA